MKRQLRLPRLFEPQKRWNGDAFVEAVYRDLSRRVRDGRLATLAARKESDPSEMESPAL